MKQFIVITLLASAALSVNGQNSIDAVLRSIEANNKELQANNQLTVSKKLEAKLDNNLPDPSVSYVHQYGNREGMGIQGELVASQSFDFPSVYVQKNKLAKSKAASFDRQGAEFRQQILLQAKEICLDLVLLNQQRHYSTNAGRMRNNWRNCMPCVWKPAMRIFWKQIRLTWSC